MGVHMVNDSDSSPVSTSYLPIPDQWLLVGLMVLGAVLTETSIPDLIRLPLTVASFVANTPDMWMPLLIVAMLITAALVLEVRDPTEKQLRLAWLVVGTVGVVGVVWFFRAGDLNWHATDDWKKEWTYYTALQESFSRGDLPWLLNASFQGTDRFYANPETNVAPQAVVLAWVDVTTFVILQCAAFLVVGMVGSYQLARDLRLGPIASMTFLAIFLMNGHLTAHFETGHGQWVGYFAFPWLFVFLHSAAMGNLGGRTQAGLALALALIEMVGGWHLFVWCIIFIGAFVAIDRSRWRFGASLALLVAGLSALRILPAMAFYDAGHVVFAGSYQRLSMLVGALVGDARGATDGMNWWEYDAFVGWVGLVVITAGLTAPLSRTWSHSVARLWMPSVVLLVLSTFNIYQWTFFQLPGFVSQRVASRLLVLGLLGFVLIGCVQLNMWLASRPLSRPRLAALALAGMLLAAQLVVHTNGRRPPSDRGLGPPSINVVSERRPDTAYVASVASGAMLTLISLGVAIRMWRRPQTLVIR